MFDEGLSEIEVGAARGAANGKPTHPFRLHHDAWGRLVLTDAAGREHVGVEVVRGFPVTAPRRCLSICDGQDRELAWIDDLDRLGPALRQAIEEVLARRELIPVVRRIRGISSHAEPSEWEVDTDRGRTRFLVRGEENVRRLPGQAALIVDANGLRYLIPDLRALDPASRRLLERLVY